MAQVRFVIIIAYKSPMFSVPTLVDYIVYMFRVAIIGRYTTYYGTMYQSRLTSYRKAPSRD